MVLLDLERGKNNRRHFTFGVKNRERLIFLVKGNGGEMALGRWRSITQQDVTRTQNSSNSFNKWHTKFIGQVVGKSSWRLSEFDFHR